MKIHADCEQHSLEWYRLRAGKVTASEMDRLISPTGKIRTGEGPRTYLLEKLADKWRGGPAPQLQNSFMMEQGNILEEYARPSFEMETDLATTRVAFIETDDGKFGCSPDGWIEAKKIGVEIKCPGLVNHLRYLLDHSLPADYLLQVQSSIFAAECEQWMFYSFARKAPSLILTIDRDEKYQELIAEAVEQFSESLEESWKLLCEMNGGPPEPMPHFVPFSTDRPRFTWERSDVPS